MGGCLRIYTDGASRGNLGPSAIGVIISNDRGNILKRGMEFIGHSTNNRAEYSALVRGLELAIQLKADCACCFLDSQLVVKQLKGEYRVKDHLLESLWARVRELDKRFRKVTYTYLPREDEKIASVDRMVREALDAYNRKR